MCFILLAVYCILHSLILYANIDRLTPLMNKYYRPTTLLEVGRPCELVAPHLARKYNRSCIVIVIMSNDGEEKNVRLEDLRNVVVLEPHFLDEKIIENLGKCEHFDVVMVHDLGLEKSQGGLDFFESLLHLGDHVFVEIADDMLQRVIAYRKPTEMFAINPFKTLCYFEVNKNKLEKSRWTARHQDVCYDILSTFYEKKLCKKRPCKVSHWKPGINLLTFIMMEGTWPTDKMVRKQLKALKNIHHNDLVLGNIVVQGATLVPIDFGDERRNIDPAVCLRAAKKVFKMKRRFKDPTEALAKYGRYLQKHRRCMKT